MRPAPTPSMAARISWTDARRGRTARPPTRTHLVPKAAGRSSASTMTPGGGRLVATWRTQPDTRSLARSRRITSGATPSSCSAGDSPAVATKISSRFSVSRPAAKAAPRSETSRTRITIEKRSTPPGRALADGDPDLDGRPGAQDRGHEHGTDPSRADEALHVVALVH